MMKLERDAEFISEVENGVIELARGRVDWLAIIYRQIIDLCCKIGAKMSWTLHGALQDDCI